jgi:hypothetical protein
VSRYDASAELVALTMLLEGRPRCSMCGFAAECAEPTTALGVCLKCWPAFKSEREESWASADRSYEETVNRGPITPGMKSPPEWLAQSGGTLSCGCLMEADGCHTFQFCADHFGNLLLRSATLYPPRKGSRDPVTYKLLPHHRLAARFNALLRGES